MLRVKLRYLEQYQKARNEVASAYDLAFENHPHISIPKRDSSSTHVFHQYTVKLNGVNRENFSKHLASFGIPTMVYYPVPVHLQVAYQNYGFQEGDFPVAEKLSHEVISLPIHTEMDPGQLELIINSINSFFQ